MEVVAAVLALAGFGLDLAAVASHSAFVGWLGMMLLLSALVAAINAMHVSE
jgi:hypothetical protein